MSHLRYSNYRNYVNAFGPFEEESSIYCDEKKPPRFRPFKRLPPELREYIWKLSLPGPRLIEVYPSPRGYDLFNEIFGYRWQATNCLCNRECISNDRDILFSVSQTCRESRRIAKGNDHNPSLYKKCFGTLVNWELDIIYIGDRTGHLHNTEFLKTVDLGGGLNNMRHLAINEEVWMNTQAIHEGFRLELKRCSPAGLVQQLKGLKTLTIVGKCGLWRDGNELTDEITVPRDWLYNDETDWIPSDTESSDGHSLMDESNDDEPRGVAMRGGAGENEEFDLDSSLAPSVDNETDEDEQVGVSMRGGAGSSHQLLIPITPGGTRTIDDDRAVSTDDGESEAEDDRSSDPEGNLAWIDIGDFWFCPGTDQDAELRGYKPRSADQDEKGWGPHDETGLALVPHELLPGNPLMIVTGKSITAAEMKEQFRGYLEELAKDETRQFFDERNDPDNERFVDYTSYVLPTIHIAVFRKTAPSCFLRDCYNLEQDFISPREIAIAKKNPDKYVRSKAVQKWYPPRFWDRNSEENLLLREQEYYLEMRLHSSRRKASKSRRSTRSRVG